MATNKKPVRFATNLGPGEKRRLTREIDVDATVEQLVVRFYQGPELSVRVYPRRIPDNGNGRPQDMVDIVGKDWIDGDGDKWTFDLSEPVSKGDILEVEIVNTADPDPQVDLSYDVTVDMALDRKNGVERVVSSFKSGFMEAVSNAS